MAKSYSIWLHGKQGDDFGFIEQKSESASQALLNWAMMLEENSNHCRKLAEAIAGTDITMDGDTHHIGLESSSAQGKALLAKLASQDLIDEEEWDDGEDDEDE